jgi:hypothetical protein
VKKFLCQACGVVEEASGAAPLGWYGISGPKLPDTLTTETGKSIPARGDQFHVCGACMSDTLDRPKLRVLHGGKT